MAGPRRHRWLAAVTVFALSITTLGAAPTHAATLCDTPPAYLQDDQILPGMTGTGYTVIQGTTVDSFDVTILGTQPDGIAPGVDFILVQVSGPVIDETGGIAAGFSGSPVYIGGKLAGSISYGFFGADPTVGGMTPASQLIKVLNYPNPVLTASTVKLSDSLRRTVAKTTGTSLADSPTTATPIAVPGVISGNAPRAMHRMQHWIKREGSPIQLTQGGSEPAPTGFVPATPEPGDSIGAVFSFGDVTFGGIGTLSIVCNDQVVAFGHPLNLDGPTNVALTTAPIIKTITDPSQAWGAFKFPNIGDLIGTIDNDRLTGVGGVAGVMPHLTPVTTNMTDTVNGTSRKGETEVAYQPYLGFISYYHMYLNLLTLTDRYAPGGGAFDTQILGTDPEGNPFHVRVRDIYWSDYDLNDIAYYATERLLYPLLRFSNDITIDSVRVVGSTTDQDLTGRIRKLEWSTPLQPQLRTYDQLVVPRGGTIHFRVWIQAPDGTLVPYDTDLKVTKSMRNNGFLYVSGGGYSYFRSSNDFGAVVHQLNNQPGFSDVAFNLYTRGQNGQASASTDYVVRGRKRVDVRIVG
ncbi:MAG: SpoIVB peptidase S55 domain-containing protein [Actinomycetota bacterium]